MEALQPFQVLQQQVVEVAVQQEARHVIMLDDQVVQVVELQVMVEAVAEAQEILPQLVLLKEQMEEQTELVQTVDLLEEVAVVQQRQHQILLVTLLVLDLIQTVDLVELVRQ
jgi:hypothetical protein